MLHGANDHAGAVICAATWEAREDCYERCQEGRCVGGRCRTARDRDRLHAGNSATRGIHRAKPRCGGEAAADAAASAQPEATPLEAGRAFLAENALRANVVTTASGLQYEVLASGDGASPGPRDMVTTHYHGTFIDGRVFDSSVQRGEPIAFPVDGVIGGWTEGLQLMKVGDKWKLYIPPDLAYGERGTTSGIGPNETLIFEVELLDVQRRG